jgi:hypothetical protein
MSLRITKLCMMRIKFRDIDMYTNPGFLAYDEMLLLLDVLEHMFFDICLKMRTSFTARRNIVTFLVTRYGIQIVNVVYLTFTNLNCC